MSSYMFILLLVALSAFTYVNKQIVTLDINQEKLTGFVVCSSGDSLPREEAGMLDEQFFLRFSY